MATEPLASASRSTASEARPSRANPASAEARVNTSCDDVIAFNALSPEVMGLVVDKFMKELNGQLAAKKVRLGYSAEVRAWLAQKGHDPRYGARPLARVIQTEIKNQLSDEILFGRLAKGGEVQLELESEKIVFRELGAVPKVS